MTTTTTAATTTKKKEKTKMDNNQPVDRGHSTDEDEDEDKKTVDEERNVRKIETEKMCHVWLLTALPVLTGTFENCCNKIPLIIVELPSKQKLRTVLHFSLNKNSGHFFPVAYLTCRLSLSRICPLTFVSD